MTDRPDRSLNINQLEIESLQQELDLSLGIRDSDSESNSNNNTLLVRLNSSSSSLDSFYSVGSRFGSEGDWDYQSLPSRSQELLIEQQAGQAHTIVDTEETITDRLLYSSSVDSNRRSGSISSQMNRNTNGDYGNRLIDGGAGGAGDNDNNASNDGNGNNVNDNSYRFRYRNPTTETISISDSTSNSSASTGSSSFIPPISSTPHPRRRNVLSSISRLGKRHDNNDNAEAVSSSSVYSNPFSSSSNLSLSRRRRRADSNDSNNYDNNSLLQEFGSSSHSGPKRRHRATSTFRKIRNSVIGSFGDGTGSSSGGSASAGGSASSGASSSAGAGSGTGADGLSNTTDNFLPVVEALPRIPRIGDSSRRPFSPPPLSMFPGSTASAASSSALSASTTPSTSSSTSFPSSSTLPSSSSSSSSPSIQFSNPFTAPTSPPLPIRPNNTIRYPPTRRLTRPWGLGSGSARINLTESRPLSRLSFGEAIAPTTTPPAPITTTSASSTSTPTYPPLARPTATYRRRSSTTTLPPRLPSPVSLSEDTSPDVSSIFDNPTSTGSTTRRRWSSRRNWTDSLHPRAMNNSSTEPDPSSFEGQAAMLARLLAVAATITARSLVGPIRSNRGFAYGRSSGGGDDMDVDESFNSFLEGLNNGLLESELTGSIESGEESAASASTSSSSSSGSSSASQRRRPQNFFRMFRFPPPSSDSNLVPVLIVGVRAVDNNEDSDPSTAADGHVGLALLDALASSGHEGRVDDNTVTPNTTAATTTTGTPATTTPSVSSPLSTTPMTATPINATPTSSTPTESFNRANSTFRNLFDSLHRTSTSRDSVVNNLFEDNPRDDLDIYSNRSSSEWRRSSESTRRGSSTTTTTTAAANSATNSTTPTREYTRQSWIVYVVGGSYPENHPILLAPTLLTDNPSYEDLIILENFLGQVKSPVATKEEVLSSGGVLTVGGTGPGSIQLLPDDRCLVCLSNYEEFEECRKLHKCGHIFHRECIDQWLLKGRNSCPLCRTEGVKSKSIAENHRSPNVPELPI